MRKQLAIGLVASCGMVVMTAAQQAGQKPQQQGGIVIKTNVINVPITFLALDKHKHFVPNLKESQIEVLDNGQQQEIQKFDAEGNLPLRIALLLDISNSINSRWQFEQQAAIDFLRSVLVEGRDQAMVAGFDTTLHVAQPFTGDSEKLEAAIHQLYPGGGTALFDALFFTAHNYLGTSVGQGEVRNVIVIISDGVDNQSQYSRDEALGQAEDMGAVIYTIGTEATGVDGKSDNVLRLLANDTGGEAFFPIEARDMGSSFQSIITDLRHQYVLAYSPNNFIANGAFHTVQIKINEKGVVTRARKGYYAQKPANGQ